MGAGHGGGYSESPSSGAAFRENIKDLAKKFPLDHDGRFGKPGRGRAQVVVSGDPAATAKEFYKKLGAGGREQILPNGKGGITWFDDGSRVVYRPVSSSDGSPAVDITITGSDGDQYKIHFQPTGFNR